MYFFIAQGVGVIALIIGIIMFQLNKRRDILWLQTIYNLLYGVQYLLLGSLNSFFMCIIGAARGIVFSFDSKFSKKVNVYILISFIILATVVSLFNWNGILSLLGCIGTIVSTVAIWQKNEKRIRILYLISAIVWLLHDVIIGSYAATLDTFILTCSIIIGIYRFDIKGKANTK